MAISRAGSLDAMVAKATTVATEEELSNNLILRFKIILNYVSFYNSTTSWTDGRLSPVHKIRHYIIQPEKYTVLYVQEVVTRPKILS